MITDQQITAAQKLADEAAADLVEAEAQESGPSGDYRRVSGARERLRNAGEYLDSLVAERRHQQRAGTRAQEQAAAVASANTSHADAEKAAKKTIDTIAVTLVDSRAQVAKASNAAMTALGELYDACAAHDKMIRATAVQLRSSGLPTDDEGLGLQWPTGGAVNGGVRLRGVWWLPVSAPAVFMRAVWGAARGRVGDQHDLTRRVARFLGVNLLDNRPDELLKASPLPALFQPPATPRPADRSDLGSLVLVDPKQPQPYQRTTEYRTVDELTHSR